MPASRKTLRLHVRQRNHLLIQALEPRLLLSYTWIAEVSNTGIASTNGANLNNVLQSNATHLVNGHYLQLGDTIVLTANATYLAPTNGFVLQNITAGTGTITIESVDIYNNLGHLATNVRVGPSLSQYMPQLETRGANKAVFSTVAYAHNYSLLGLEVLPSAATDGIVSLITLGDGSSAQNNVSMVPTNFLIDRCYIHSYDATATVASDTDHAIALNSANTTIQNSYISDIHSDSEDAQAIGGWNGTGNYLITNNFLEATGENIMFGGANSYLGTGVDPNNIAITHNYFFKPLSWDPFDPSWDGLRYSVKNLFELKHATNVTFDQNLLENCWVGADQVGEAIAVGPKNQGGLDTWAIIHDVTITNNVIRNVGEGIQLGFDSLSGSDTSLPMYNVVIQNNLIETVNGSPDQGPGDGIAIGAYTAPGWNLTIDHNTIISSNLFIILNKAATHPSIISSGFTCTNNIFIYGQYGLFTTDGEGTAGLNILCPGGTFSNNAILGGGNPSLYPSGNYFLPTEDAAGFVDTPGENYGVLATVAGGGANPLHNGATNGTDVGAPMSAFTGITDFAPDDSTLQNYYKFDEGSGSTALDSSGNNHTATLNGTFAWSTGTSAEMSDALSLTGGTSGSASVSSFTTDSNFTFAAWVNPASTSATQYIGSTANSAFSLYINSSGKLVAAGTTGSVTDSTALTTGQWYLVAVTFDGANIRLYKNGTLVGSPTAGTTTAGTTTLTIGGNKGSVNAFNGDLDEVRYYSSALNGTVTPISTVTQMQSLYNGFGPIINPIEGPKFGTQTGSTIALSTTAIGHATTYPGGFNAPSSLSFYWTTISGPTTVSFSGTQGTNAAQNTTITFFTAGKYMLQLTVTDGLGGSTTILDPLTVVQTPQGTPSISMGGVVTSSTSVATNGTISNITSNRGTGLDQFGNALTGTWTWSLAGPDTGSLSTTVGTSSTIYTASPTAGSDTLQLKYTDSTQGTTVEAHTNISIGGTPLAPTLNSATPSGYTIALNWTNNAGTNETGFYVESTTATDGTGFTNLTPSGLSSTTTTFTDSSSTDPAFIAGTIYYYEVLAFNSSGNSPASNQLNTQTIPTAPTNLSANPGTNSISLKWNNNSSGLESGFHIYRSTTSGSFTTVYATTGSGAANYLDTAAAAGTAYYYQVTAYNASGDSAGTTNSCAVATVIAYEGFNYTTGVWNGGDTGVGLSSNWTINNTSHVSILSGSLTYSAVGHALTTTANEVQVQQYGNISNTLASSVGTAGSSLWVGFEFSAYLNPNSTTIAPEVSLGTNGSNAARLGSYNGHFGAHMQAGGHDYYMDSGIAIAANTTAFVVFKIQYLTTGDIISLYLNPTPGVTPTTATKTLTMPATSQLTSTNAISMYGNDANTVATFDELRLGLSYAAVAPDPLVPLTPTHSYSAPLLNTSLTPNSAFSIQHSSLLASSFLNANTIPTISLDLSTHTPTTDYQLYNPDPSDQPNPYDLTADNLNPLLLTI